MPNVQVRSSRECIFVEADSMHDMRLLFVLAGLEISAHSYPFCCVLEYVLCMIDDFLSLSSCSSEAPFNPCCVLAQISCACFLAFLHRRSDHPHVHFHEMFGRVVMCWAKFTLDILGIHHVSLFVGITLTHHTLAIDK